MFRRTLEEREAGTTNDVVKTQITGGLKDVTAAEMAKRCTCLRTSMGNWNR